MPVSRGWNIHRLVVSVLSLMTRLLPRPNRITLERRKKAILIGINYEGSDQLNFSQRNTEKVRRLLKGTFGFQDDDIIILTDNVADVEAGTSLLPTWENIMRIVKEFIIPGQDNTDYVLFFSGHSGQHPSANIEEEDGFQEFLIPMDAQKDAQGEYLPGWVIYDTYLHKNIIIPLEKGRGCHLFAVFDGCQSATMLNLRHHRCNRVGTVTSTFRRAIRHYIVEDVLVPIRNSFLRKRATQSPESEASASTSKFRKCNGLCLRVPNTQQKSTVICISACKNSEARLEHDESGTLTSAIVELLETNSNASLKDVMYAVRSVVDDMRRVNEVFLRRRTSITLFKQAKMITALARWNPQLSSNDSLDINTTLMY